MFNSQDKTLVCSDCGQEFTFTAGEQEFFTQKGFSQPSRCKFCRAARKVSQNSGDSYGNGGSRPGGERAGGARQMYPAVCAQCGKSTQVPFLPRNDRPVYCSNCFEQQNTSNGGYGGGSRGRSRW